MRDEPGHPTDDELIGLGDRELSGHRGRTAEHVASCAACQDRSRRLAAALVALTDEYRETLGASPDAHRETRRALGEQLQILADRAGRSPGARLRAVLTPGVWWAPPVAAALVLLLWSVGWRGHTTTAIESESVERRILPITTLTPGAVASVRLEELCDGSVATPPIPDEMRRTVLSAYAMLKVPDTQYELDYLITPELGGSTDPRNLWPQRYGARRWNARVKDELEDLLPGLVCGGELDLATAQHDMAVDWIAAYKKYFRTTEPRQTYSRREQDQELGLAFGPDRPAAPLLHLAGLRDTSGGPRPPIFFRHRR